MTADLSALTDRAAGVAVRRDKGDDRIAIVTLARPERRNAMTPTMWHHLARIGRELPADIRVVVVKGDGPSFCAGIDLRMFTDDGVPGEPPAARARDDGFDAAVAGYQAGFTWLREPRFVSIAQVQGHAIGAGFQLALACDLRVLARDAVLCMKEPALGLVPDLTGTKPLVDIVGLPKAIEICLTARTVDAAEAEQLGLAEKVVAGGELDAEVRSLALALLETNEAAARATKQLLMHARGRTLEEQAAAERAAQKALLSGQHY